MKNENKIFSNEDLLSFVEAKESLKIEIKKFNKYNQLCYYDSIDLTNKGFTDEQIEIISNLFSKAKFKVEIKNHTYFGIYDPSKMCELIEIYPEDLY